MRLCPICKTKIEKHDEYLLEGKIVHQGYCSQVLAEIIIEQDRKLNEAVATEQAIAETQMLVG